MDEALFARLSSTVGLVALVGDRIYPVTRPGDGTLPTLVYQRVSGPRVASLSGSSGLARPRYQLTAWALTHDEAKAVLDQAHPAIADGFTGDFAGVRVLGGSHVDSDRDVYDDDARAHGVQRDFFIWHREG